MGSFHGYNGFSTVKTVFMYVCMYQHRYLITHSWMLKESSYGLKSEHLKALEDIRISAEDYVIIIK